MATKERIINTPKGWIWHDELPLSLGNNRYYVKPESDPYGFFDYFNEIWEKFWNENS